MCCRRYGGSTIYCTPSTRERRKRTLLGLTSNFAVYKKELRMCHVEVGIYFDASGPELLKDGMLSQSTGCC